MITANQTIEKVVRASYGKLVSILVRATSGDILRAEDCLSSAFEKALEVWPKSGIPDNPEAWLITTAKNLFLDGIRHLKVQDNNRINLIDHLIEIQNSKVSQDYRLELLFMCSHPSIDSSIRTPLMLQTIMGFKVEDIAGLFLISPSALEKRLTRAKQKIKIAQIPFSKPELSEISDRLQDVLETIYGVFGKSWDHFNEDLEDEAIYLSEILAQAMPHEPEPQGLLSLLYFSKSRKLSRRKNDEFIPLFEQDISLWDHRLIEEAERILKNAFALKKLDQPFGRFQIEAAIQSAHLAKIMNNVNTDQDLILLYEELISVSDSIGARVAFGAALLRMNQLDRVQDLIGQMDEKSVAAFQPYWILRAELSLALNDLKSSKIFLETAIGFTADLAIKSLLIKRIQSIHYNDS